MKLKRLKKLDADTLGKRKRPQTHDNIAETSIQMKEMSVLDMNSTKELSSLAQFPMCAPTPVFGYPQKHSSCSSQSIVKRYWKLSKIKSNF